MYGLFVAPESNKLFKNYDIYETTGNLNTDGGLGPEIEVPAPGLKSGPRREVRATDGDLSPAIKIQVLP